MTGAIVCRGHKQKVLAHRFYLVPGFAGRVCAVAAFVRRSRVVGGFYFLSGWCSFKLSCRSCRSMSR
jgi:hypothetical protein